MLGDMWDRIQDDEEERLQLPLARRCLPLSLLLVMSIQSIAKAKILLCATFNAQVAEHFSQILPFTFPSAADRERIVITSVSVCLSAPQRECLYLPLSTYLLPAMRYACGYTCTHTWYIQYICRIFWLFYLWSQQQCNKIKLLCVSLSLSPATPPNNAQSAPQSSSYLWLVATLAANRCALVKCAKFIAYFCACGGVCVCASVCKNDNLRVRAMPILHPFDWPSCRLKLYNATRKLNTRQR